jgi:hypothetical protein
VVGVGRSSIFIPRVSMTTTDFASAASEKLRAMGEPL